MTSMLLVCGIVTFEWLFIYPYTITISNVCTRVSLCRRMEGLRTARLGLDQGRSLAIYSKSVLFLVFSSVERVIM